MRFILYDGNGYYSGMGRDRYQCRAASVTGDPDEAVIFLMTVENGKAVIKPELPDDHDVCWRPIPVEVRMRRAHTLTRME